MELTHRCPCCGGDGKETCDNPDHGFIAMCAGISDLNRLGCPVCGHDKNFKVRYYDTERKSYKQRDCEYCDGVGKVTKEHCEKLCDEYGIDVYIDEFEIWT